ncbi:proline-rich protein 3 [Sesamum indicum]|uniref:Proline-rich protein 3 n=1 Tax=Sesamum indicum TaxID=4182 RepID=A0A8M8V3R2_SESIN|nr:proline-rich protein 3 [Sesamum indicum]
MPVRKFSHLLCLFLLSMIVVASASGYGYGSKPDVESSKSSGTRKKFLPGVFSVQGMIYCKSGSKVFPLKGGVVRITCLGIDKDGYETAPFSILSRPTDANGYFFSKLSSQLLEDDGVKISQCKVFLHSCPLKTCPVATDVNKGLSGAPLSAYRPIGFNNMRLYSVGPFVYSSETQKSFPYGY